MIFLELFITFFIIGAFTFGGGYAMLSLIQNQVVTVHQWLTPEEFTDIVAISQMSPGPIGINSATYIGYSVPHAMGFSPAISVLGSVTATFAVVLPSYLLVLWICILFEKFRSNRYFASVLKVMRPVTDNPLQLHRLVELGSLCRSLRRPVFSKGQPYLGHHRRWWCGIPDLRPIKQLDYCRTSQILSVTLIDFFKKGQYQLCRTQKGL